MDRAPPDAQLLDLIDSISRLYQAELRVQAGVSGLQPVHLQTLRYLQRANRYSNSPQAIVDFLGLTKGTVSQSLLLLFRKGLIERFADPNDRRIVRLRLSPKATDHLRSEYVARDWAAAALELPPGDAAALVDKLTGFLRLLQRRRGGRSFGVCKTCAHFVRESASAFRCGLTGEALDQDDSHRICREHTSRASDS